MGTRTFISKNYRLAYIIAMLVIAISTMILINPQPAQASTVWSSKSDIVQVSEYGPDEGETITATGKRIGYTQKYVAVPISNIVSKSTWNRLSKKERYYKFYYGERLKIYHGKYSVVCTVQDCGGFGSYGGTYKGKWRKRLFDCTPGTKQALRFSGLAFVRFQYDTRKAK